ncbi:MAG TPA: glycosyl hydrolase [Candidatus Binatia bacterium]|jgi:unsaturated chondroitin disaccharide hydrolase|nr:glycosyl hydrolase [Candidatus Binatia bacterium]
MPLKINEQVTAEKLRPKIERLFALSAGKIVNLEKSWNPMKGTPVFTARGRYTARGWTEWTQGFQFGSALLQFDATGDKRFLEIGRRKTIELMARHVSHIGVHDHGFNNISTYGNLWRLMREGKIPFNAPAKDFYELALKVSGAVQAARWTPLRNGKGYIYSFNGPHSLFVDTMRSLRSLALAHQLGHVLMGERDQRISLLQRLIEHGETTAEYNIYLGEGRDSYDAPGRTAHESIFNAKDGTYRCANSQQGYSPFSTWTRGLAWAILGYAEQLEFLDTKIGEKVEGVSSEPPAGEREASRDALGTARPTLRAVSSVVPVFRRAAAATADFYLANCCTDGIPSWDTGAPNLHRLGDYLNKPANPFNSWEPVDSSAAVVAAQGLIRLGNYVTAKGEERNGTRYRQAGLTIAETLFAEPYLSTTAKHQGLLLHSVYHRPNGWDYIAPGQKVPNGESSMWGDYHARELALLLLREARDESYLTFFAKDSPR